MTLSTKTKNRFALHSISCRCFNVSSQADPPYGSDWGRSGALTDGNVGGGAARRVRGVVRDRVGALIRVHVSEQQQVHAVLIPQRLIPAQRSTSLLQQTVGLIHITPRRAPDGDTLESSSCCQTGVRNACSLSAHRDQVPRAHVWRKHSFSCARTAGLEDCHV